MGVDAEMIVTVEQKGGFLVDLVADVQDCEEVGRRVGFRNCSSLSVLGFDVEGESRW